MKKGLLLAALFCTPVGLYADAGMAEVVQVTLTFYRDKEECSDKRWQEVVAPAQAVCTKNDATLQETLEAVDAVMDAVIFGKRDGNKGIHGEISIVASDGQCSTRCGDGCPCKKNGACLCAVKGTSCSQECNCAADLQEDAARGCHEGGCTRDDKEAVE